MARLFDEIIEEIHAVRHAHAAQFNFDIDLILKDLKESEAAHTKSGWAAAQPSPPYAPLRHAGFRRTRFAAMKSE